MEPGTYIAGTRPLPVFLGTCAQCVRPVRVNSDEASGDKLAATCPDCAAAVALERLYGTVSRMECAGACMSAYGPTCSCACGGINHGGVWSKSGTMLAGELERYRAGVAARQAEAEKRAAKARTRRQSEFDRWAEGNAAIVAGLAATDWQSEFMADMAELVADGKPLSERQAAAVERALARVAQTAVRAAERAAAQAARAGTVTDVPAGRHEVAGVIVGMYRRPAFRGDGDTIGMIVETPDWTVSGNAPIGLLLAVREAAIAERGDYSPDRDLRGRRVRFTATLKQGDREKGRGFFSRPTGAELLPAAELATA